MPELSVNLPLGSVTLVEADVQIIKLNWRRDPIPIIPPCHWIISANDKLTGYTGAGSTRTKSFLLDLESHQTELPLTTTPHKSESPT
jgi:hypothetical protein